MRSNVISIFILLFAQQGATTTLEDLTLSLANIPEDGRLQFCELANKRGFKCVRYNVTTEDGYVLGVFNIPGNRSKPVYLQHGFVDSSDTFLIANTSIIPFLASEGYDIWAGNMRGNSYSKKHVSLTPEDPKFWEFSFHEIGMYDVAATIDFILETTRQTKLQAIGHSQGTSLFYVLGSTRPEYNDKIKVFISLGPVAYLVNVGTPLASLSSIADYTGILPSIAHGEFLSNSSELIALVKTECTAGTIGYTLCSDGFFFPAFGYDPAQFDENLLKVVIGHYPAGTSVKNALHTMQLITGKRFAQYNYGSVENLLRYKSIVPPEYNLSKYVVKTALVVGLNDRLSKKKDVQILKTKMPNVIDYYEIPYELWNHIDFVWGSYIPIYLSGYILGILEKYY